MLMTKKILLFLFIIALHVSCSSSAKVANDPVGKRLVFGNGGGFTGIYTNYQLDENGNVYAILADSTLKPVKKLRKKQTRDIFAQAEKIRSTLPTFNHPGNMTWFIRYRVNGEENEYLWGDSNASFPIEIKDLYNQLNTFVK